MTPTISQTSSAAAARCRLFCRHSLFVVALAALLSACASKPKQVESANAEAPPTASGPSASQALKDQRVALDFKDRGVEITYTTGGKLQRVSVWGVAPAWKPNYDILAEIDAKNKLVRFVHGEQVDSTSRQALISRSIDKVTDKAESQVSKVTAQEPDAAENRFDSASLFDKNPSDAMNNPPTNVESIRAARTIEESLLRATSSIVASGRLVGVVKTQDARSQDGRFYYAKYEWSDETQGASRHMRSEMAR